MALIKCPECEKEISDKAPSCPNCGVPIVTNSDNDASIHVGAQTQTRIIPNIDGPKVQTKKIGSRLDANYGKIRTQGGQIEIKGVILSNLIGDVKNIVGIIYKNKKRTKAEFDFGSYVVVVTSTDTLEAFVSKLADSKSVTFTVTDAPEGGAMAKVFQWIVTGFIVIFIYSIISNGTDKIVSDNKIEQKTSLEKVFVQRSTINVRGGPSISENVVTKLSWGTSLNILSNKGEWSEVEFTNGEQRNVGWISRSFVGSKAPPALISESCSRVVKQFELLSNLSDLQKDEIWKKYKDKAVKWDLYFDNVDTQTFSNDLTVQYKCSNDPYSLGADLYVDYPEPYRDSLLKAKKGQRFNEIIILRSRVGGTLFGDKFD